MLLSQLNLVDFEKDVGVEGRWDFFLFLQNFNEHSLCYTQKMREEATQVKGVVNRLHQQGCGVKCILVTLEI